MAWKVRTIARLQEVDAQGQLCRCAVHQGHPPPATHIGQAEDLLTGKVRTSTICTNCAAALAAEHELGFPTCEVWAGPVPAASAPPARTAPATGRKPVTFEIPKGTRAKLCASCIAEIYWIETTNGKRMPLNPDGTSHFATCPAAAEHRRPR